MNGNIEKRIEKRKGKEREEVNEALGEVKGETEEEKISKGKEFLNKGRSTWKEGNFKTATEEFKKTAAFFEMLAKEHPTSEKIREILSKAREHLKGVKHEWGETLYELGRESVEKKERPEATKYFQEAVKKDPKLIGAWVELGNQFTILGNSEKDPKKAQEYYEKAHRNLKDGLLANQESKEKWMIWNGLANLFFQIGEYPRAYNCLLEAAELEKENFVIPYNLAIALLNLPIGDPAVNTINAKKYLEEAEKKNPTSSEITSVKAESLGMLREMKASEETTLASYKNELEAWEQAIEKDPNNVRAWYKKGLLLPILQRGKPKKWLKESNKCFNEVFRILEKRGEEKTEFTAEVWYQKARIWKYWSDFNPYREKGHRNKDLKQCAKCLNISLKILKPLSEKNMLTENGLKMLIAAQQMSTEVEEKLKRIEEYAKFGGAKKVKPKEEINPMYV